MDLLRVREFSIAIRLVVLVRREVRVELAAGYPFKRRPFAVIILSIADCSRRQPAVSNKCAVPPADIAVELGPVDTFLFHEWREHADSITRRYFDNLAVNGVIAAQALIIADFDLATPRCFDQHARVVVINRQVRSRSITTTTTDRIIRQHPEAGGQRKDLLPQSCLYRRT